MLVQNPIFSAQSTYTVFSHILQNLTTLNNGDHQLLVHWFRDIRHPGSSAWQSYNTSFTGELIKYLVLIYVVSLNVDIKDPEFLLELQGNHLNMTPSFMYVYARRT